MPVSDYISFTYHFVDLAGDSPVAAGGSANASPQ
jgi:hypothetical protein